MLLNPTPVSSLYFSFNKKTNTFSNEVSDLRGFRLGRVYNDSCDRGFTIVSSKTGKAAVFALNNILKDASGEDTGGWEFICVTPGMKHMKEVIFND